MDLNDRLYDPFVRDDQYGTLGRKPQSLLEYARLVIMAFTLVPMKFLGCLACVAYVWTLCRCVELPTAGCSKLLAWRVHLQKSHGGLFAGFCSWSLDSRDSPCWSSYQNGLCVSVSGFWGLLQSPGLRCTTSNTQRPKMGTRGLQMAKLHNQVRAPGLC